MKKLWNWVTGKTRKEKEALQQQKRFWNNSACQQWLISLRTIEEKLYGRDSPQYKHTDACCGVNSLNSVFGTWADLHHTMVAKPMPWSDIKNCGDEVKLEAILHEIKLANKVVRKSNEFMAANQPAQ